MPDCYTTGQLAAELGCSGHWLSNLLYRNAELARQCQMYAGRRLIPKTVVPKIKQAMQKHRRKEDTT